MDLRSGAAFWPLRSGLLHVYPALDADATADVAIIGAGITGALVAHRLTTAGASVVVVDRRDVASGSTAATTGLLQHATDSSLTELSASVGETKGARAYRLGLEAVDAIEALVGELGEDSGFERRPTLYLASSRRDARALASEHALRLKHGFDVDWLPGAELRAHHGIDAPAAIYCRGDGQIDAYRFTHALLHDAVRLGAHVYDRTSAVSAKAGDDHVLIETDRGPQIRARHLVWASGYEALEDTHRRLGRLHSTWAFVSEPIQDLRAWSERAMVWETARPYLYARVTDDGRAMVGGLDEPFSTRHANPRLQPRKTAKLVERLKRWFPDLTVEVAYAWAGAFTTTKDGLPYIGTMPEHPRAWLALGYGGNGITFSMIAADLIRDAWLGHANPDASIFAFDR